MRTIAFNIYIHKPYSQKTTGVTSGLRAKIIATDQEKDWIN